ncbi:MAG TPA: lamin tail domain-containing protein, partial [Chryseosolibacter sp.]
FIVNNDLQLQLNHSAAGTSWLYTHFPTGEIGETEWELFIKQSFSASGANFGRFYLTSDQEDLSGSLNGYYLQFGETGTEDAIELFRQTGTSKVSVCRGRAAAIASSFGVRVKVRRSTDGDWEVLVDYTGGSDFISEASGRDTMHPLSLFFGVLCTYTVTNATRFFYDDIVVRTAPLPDTSPPEVIFVEATSSRSLTVLFSEKLALSQAESIQNYFVSPTSVNPVSAAVQEDQRTVLLSFDQPFTNGVDAVLTIRAIADLSGNQIAVTEKPFVYFEVQPVAFRDIIINEIFADPSPQVGLPASEFIEVLNRSQNPVQLEGWLFSDGVSTGVLPPSILLPGAYMIISPESTAQQYELFGRVLPVSNFPTLNNAADRLLLMDPGENIIDSVSYQSNWYHDEDKALGGWTLERINPEQQCDGASNWKASDDLLGGTPGKQNSVMAISLDNEGPRLLHALLVSSTTFELVFDEQLNLTAPQTMDISIDPPAGVDEVSFADESLTRISVQVQQSMDTLTPYSVTVENAYDCPGNLIAEDFNRADLNQDLIAPDIMAVQALDANTVSILFSEKVSGESSQLISNYFIDAIGNPSSAVLYGDQTSLTLVFSSSFRNGFNYQLVAQGVTDLGGNLMPLKKIPFLFFIPSPATVKDVIITEFLPDPAPPQGLPEQEYIELYNRSASPMNLDGWSLADGSRNVHLGPFILLPGSYVILTDSHDVESYQSFGQVLQVSPFPSLNNAGDMIILKDADGVLIDSLSYTEAWYRDEEKAEGGWSLELIDPENICLDDKNWIAAEAVAGGTPGSQNSVYASRPDNTGPQLVSALPVDSLTLILSFDEKLEKRIPDVAVFTIAPPLKFISIAFEVGSLNRISLTLGEPIIAGKEYTIAVASLFDCTGNRIQDEFSRARFVLPQEAFPQDIIINEILFNPRPTGVDFVELYNRSLKTIDLKDWSLRNFGSGAGKTRQPITEENLLIYPGDYLVVTEDADVLKGEYIMGIERAFLQTQLPGFNDEQGSATLLDADGIVIDSMSYSEKMHSPFVRDDEGISLERISVDGENEVSNWRSASSTVGFATPGYLNSNYKENDFGDSEAVSVSPEIFQPLVNSAGFTQIKYHFERGGFIANVKIVDQQGRTVREVAQNALLGREGFFRWDGEQDNGAPARTGYYLVWFEIFDTDGMLKTYKKRVAVF